MNRVLVSMGAGIVVLALSGCAPSGSSLEGELQGGDPAVRVRAIIRAAERSDQAALPYLVDRLTDSDRSVRMYAILALKKLTGQTLGYCHYAPARERAEVAQRWRDWLGRNRGAATRPATGNAQEAQP